MTNSDNDRIGGKTEERKGEAFVEDAGNTPGAKGGLRKTPTVCKEETGATESGEEDKGAKM